MRARLGVPAEAKLCLGRTSCAQLRRLPPGRGAAKFWAVCERHSPAVVQLGGAHGGSGSGHGRLDGRKTRSRSTAHRSLRGAARQLRAPLLTEAILARVQKCSVGTTFATLIAAARAADSASAASLAPLLGATRGARAALHAACDAASVRFFELHLHEVRAATGDDVGSLEAMRLNAESAKSLAQSAATELERCEAAEDAHAAAVRASLERGRGAEAAHLREAAAQCAAGLQELREAFAAAAARAAAADRCAGRFEQAVEASKAVDRVQAEVFGEIFLSVFGGTGAADAAALLKSRRDVFQEQLSAAFSDM